MQVGSQRELDYFARTARRRPVSATLTVALILLSLLPGAAAAQVFQGQLVDVSNAIPQTTTSLRGTILDSESRLPVGGVFVLVDGSEYPRTTDDAGVFRVDSLRLGSRALIFMRDGYTPRTLSFVVGEHHEGVIDIGVLLLARGPSPTASITGTVTDSLTGLPVLSARVHVNGVYVAVTDLHGEFWIPSIQLVWGSNLLEYRRIGYTPKHAELWTARDSLDVETEIGLMPLAVLMAEVVVEGERTVYHLGQSRDFVRRSRTGLGYYFTERDIEDRQPYLLTDMLSRVPGVMVSPTSSGNIVQILRRGACSPLVFLDGTRLTYISASDIDDLVGPEDVSGVEVYKGAATVPFEFGFINDDCGVIAIWTKR